MKKLFLKSVSVTMCLVITLLSVFCVQGVSESNNCTTDFPVIYIKGQGDPLVRKLENGETERIYPIQAPVGDFIKVAEKNIDIFVKALITQEWTDFGNLVRDTVTPIYGKLALGKDGHPTDGSYCESEINNTKINTSTVNGKYRFDQFAFRYDWRLDPYEIADKLHEYIENVLQKTNCDHVGIISRCLGSCIAAAYMEKYDGEYVTDLVVYASALNGVEKCSKLFSGDLYLDSDAIERCVYESEIVPDRTVNELIQAFVTVFKATYGIDLACLAVNNVWQDIYIDIFPQVLIETFGTLPGYWSMVSDEDYIRAKDNVFHNQDLNEWSEFIDIIDNYHYNVQVNAPVNFKKYADRDISISNITKYGFQTLPILSQTDILSDRDCSVYAASMGATASGVDSVLSQAYLDSADLKYVSPDKQIDASTCLFPEKTWFIKNVRHNDFPDNINPLVCTIINTHTMTVDTDEKYPQYMLYSENGLTPITEENTGSKQYKHTLFEAVYIIIRNLFKLIKNSLASRTEATVA